jgi:hypothetical protein
MSVLRLRFTARKSPDRMASYSAVRPARATAQASAMVYAIGEFISYLANAVRDCPGNHALVMSERWRFLTRHPGSSLGQNFRKGEIFSQSAFKLRSWPFSKGGHRLRHRFIRERFAKFRCYCDHEPNKWTFQRATILACTSRRSIKMIFVHASKIMSQKPFGRSYVKNFSHWSNAAVLPLGSSGCSSQFF